MKRWWLCVRLAVLGAWTMGSALATAQDMKPPTGYVAPMPMQGQYAPVMGGDSSAGCGCQGDLQRSQEENAPGHPFCEGIKQMCEWISRPIVNCLNSKGLGCCATQDSWGCTSLYAQYNFIFGSCREFFIEPCVPPPPGQPWGGACGCKVPPQLRY
jgi:hypothetical protein